MYVTITVAVPLVAGEASVAIICTEPASVTLVSARYRPVFCVSFSLAAGALWEIFEFLMDTTFGFNMQKSGLVDTMTDLMIDFFGACVVGIGVYRYLEKDEDGLVKILVNRFIRYNLKRKRIYIRRKKIKNST